MSGRRLIFCVTTCLAAAPSYAAVLFDPVTTYPCSSLVGGTAGSANCSILPAGQGLKVTVVAEQIDASDPAQAAKATVGLPDARQIALDGAMLFNGHLMPEVWQVEAGQLLEYTLVNKLKPGAGAITNIHTHGLLVSPDLPLSTGSPQTAIEPVGDTVYVCTEPVGQAASEGCLKHGAVLGADPARMSYQVPIPLYHPEGTFWYHPHVHMNARHQVGSGLSGMIFVRNLTPGGGHAQFDAVERFMMLKDIQVDTVTATDGTHLRGSVVSGENRAPDICGDQTPDAPPYPGFCEASDKSKAWLFMVNGQVLPSVTVASGTKEVWRLVNASPDMSYDLGLIQKGSGKPLKFQVLARDGVSANTSESEDVPSEPVLTDRALLMPGARIEVAIDRSTADWGSDSSVPIAATLRTHGYFTGDGTSGTDGAAMGDKWPVADLIDVLIERAPQIAAVSSTITPPAPGSTPTGAFRASIAALHWSQPVKVGPWLPPAGAAKTLSPARVAFQNLVAPETTNPPAAHSHDGMPVPPADMTPPAPTSLTRAGRGSADPCDPLMPGWQRVVALNIVKDPSLAPPEQFKIGASCAPVGLKWPPPPQLATALASAAMFGDAGSPVLHARAGRSEIWTIYNSPQDSNHELHNFHIHQMKYEVLEVYDPTGRITAPVSETAANRRVDSFPVPVNGYLRIRIAFTPDMVGKFVFHCHILEHEDKGMMAQIVVQ